MPSSGDRAAGARKRDRYTAYACNRCRAAKVRCNGKLPCSYCVARDPASCHYQNPRAIHDSKQQEQQQPQDQLKSAEGSHVASIQANSASGVDPVDYESVKTLLQHQNHKLDAILQRVSNVEAAQRLQQHEDKTLSNNVQLGCEEPLPVIQSPTSAFFCIHIIDNNLRALGEPTLATQPLEDRKPSSPSSFSILHDQIVGEIVADIGEWDDTGLGESSSGPSNAIHSIPTYPLGNLDNGEIIRLIQKYHDVAGMMYPVVDVARMLDLAEIAEPVNHMNAVPNKGGSPHLRRSDAVILQMMVAIALAAENENGSDLIQSLHNDVLPDAQHIVWNTKTDLHGLVLLALVSIFYYRTHKWRLAWRFLGNVARIVVELGLNRRIVLDRSFPHLEARTQALNVIWSVFVLEQQLRHGLGLSMTRQDLILDPTFPKPVNAPYLEAMIQYLRIGNHASETMAYDRQTAQLTPEELQEAYTYFQYRLSEWYKNINGEFQLKAQDEKIEKWNRHLSITLHLRANTLQIGVARYILFGKGVSAILSAEIWSTCINAAASIASILAAIDADPPQFQSARPESNYFLISGLGILLLAISQNTVLPMAERPLSPETFHKAQQSAVLCLSLLRNRANSSRPSKHLWKRVQSLAVRLNLLNGLAPLGQGTGAEQPETMNETRDTTSLPLMLEPTLGSFQSSIDFGSSALSGIADISVPSRNVYSPLSMALDSTYIFNQLLADFE
ncbi:hypothetical protein ACHAQJ_001620 [Trichoderma viride]